MLDVPRYGGTLPSSVAWADVHCCSSIKDARTHDAPLLHTP